MSSRKMLVHFPDMPVMASIGLGPKTGARNPTKSPTRVIGTPLLQLAPAASQVSPAGSCSQELGVGTTPRHAESACWHPNSQAKFWFCPNFFLNSPCFEYLPCARQC